MPSLLNNERISTQLRDWVQMSQQKSLKFAGSPESTSYFAESCRYVIVLEFINQQAEEIRVIRANHAQLLKDFDARNELLEKEQQDHFLTKGTLMVREAELAEERKIYKAARPGALGSSWVMVPCSDVSMGDERERCPACTEKHGPATCGPQYVAHLCSGVVTNAELTGWRCFCASPC